MEKISWSAPEYIHTEKTTDWYWILGIVAVSVAIIAVILSDAVFGLLIIVSAFVLALHASRPPQIIDIEIGRNGVTFGKTLHLYEHLDAFWIETRGAHPRLILKSDKKIVPHIVALLEDVHPDDIRNYLEEYLPEIEQSEPFFEKLLLYLGF